MKSSHTRRPLNQQSAEHVDQPFFGKQQEGQKKDDAFFQTKLAVGGKEDKQEKEANAVGDKVQKKAEEEKEKTPVQKKEEEKKEPGVQKMDKKDDEPVQKKEAPEEKDKDKTKVSKKEEEKKEPGGAQGKKDEEPVQKKEAPEKKDEDKTKVNKKEEEKKEPGGGQEKKDEEPVQKMAAGDEKDKDKTKVNKKEDEKEPVQKMSDGDKDESKTQAKKGGPSQPAPKASVEERIKASKGKGHALPDEVRKKMEAELKVDLSQVRIHTDAKAVSMNKELHSLAFTNGHDIYFNAGQYQPNSAAGQGLLAHELTHVVQQTGLNKKPSDKK